MVESDIVADLARGMADHDQAKMTEARRRLKEWNERNPDLPIRINMKQVISRVKQMKMEKAGRLAKTAPREIRRQVRDMTE
jgi:hypothetical protein